MQPFFGSTHHVVTYLQEIDKNAAHERHVLIVAYNINCLDLAGAEMPAHESHRRQKLRGGLYLCGLKHEAGESTVCVRRKECRALAPYRSPGIMDPMGDS